MKTILSFLILSFSVCVSGQEKSINENFQIGFCYDLSIQSHQNTQLNSFLQSNDFFSITNPISISSIGYSLRISDRVPLIKTSFLIGKSYSNNDNENSYLNLFGVSLDLLMDFNKSEKWLLAPILGMQMSTFHLNASSMNTTSLLSNAALVENFQINNKLLPTLGFEVDRRIKIDYINVFLGLKTFYTFNFKGINWQTSNHQKIIDIPSKKFSDFGLSYTIRIEFDLQQK